MHDGNDGHDGTNVTYRYCCMGLVYRQCRGFYRYSVVTVFWLMSGVSADAAGGNNSRELRNGSKAFPPPSSLLRLGVLALIGALNIPWNNTINLHYNIIQYCI